MSRPLTKTEWVNLPLSIPKEWKIYFDAAARTLGGSRNQALCMALKLGGPILGKYIEVMRADLEKHYSAIAGAPEFPSEILGATGPAPEAAKLPPDERTNHKPRNHPPGKPGSGKKGP